MSNEYNEYCIDYESNYESDYEHKCQFCDKDRFLTAFGHYVHSWFYCEQNPERLEPIKPVNELWYGQYIYPVHDNLERQFKLQLEKQ